MNLMERTNNEAREQPLLGVDFVFDAGLKKIEEHQKTIDSLDLKMGVLIGLLGAFIVGMLAAVFSGEAPGLAARIPCAGRTLLALGAVLVGVSLLFAFQAFRVREFFSGVRFQDLIEWTNEETRITKGAFLPTLLESVELNESRIKRKQRNAKAAVWFVFVALMIFLSSLIVIGLKLMEIRAG
jgi:hypothetical protein